MPELLAPAGNLDKLACALRFGADAVYCGLEQFSLRALAGNLSMDDLRKGCDLAHAQGKRLYLTLNAFLRPGEESEAKELLESLKDVPIDAYIVADPGMVLLSQELDPSRPLHLSTQANTTSSAAAHFWQLQGVKRLNVARELSLEEIATMHSEIPGVELEIFVHGAMCMAYSGRCLLSAGLSGRSANRGACSHPCRWQYALQEETRPGEFFPVEEDARGTYILNSRDLCLINHIPELLGTGIHSLKIEGRMKSLYYVAAVTRVYRAALDRWQAGPDHYQLDPQWHLELNAVSHRPYGTGFLFDRDQAFVHAEDSSYHRQCDFVGIVKDVLPEGFFLIEGRNRIQSGDCLEVIGPQMINLTTTFSDAIASDGSRVSTVQPNAMVRMRLPEGSRTGDLLRRWRDI